MAQENSRLKKDKGKETTKTKLFSFYTLSLKFKRATTFPTVSPRRFVIGIGEYDSVEMMKTSLDTYKITFPVVYESDSRDARQQTPHYEYRKISGDTRKWGSPWNIFLIPSALKTKGDTLTEKTFVVNGELIEADAEAFIREKLGLPKEEKKTETSQNKPGEVCEPTTSLKKPEPR